MYSYSMGGARVFILVRPILHSLKFGEAITQKLIIVGVVRRSLESWWRQPTFQRCGLALHVGDSGEYLHG